MALTFLISFCESRHCVRYVSLRGGEVWKARGIDVETQACEDEASMRIFSTLFQLQQTRLVMLTLLTP